MARIKIIGWRQPRVIEKLLFFLLKNFGSWSKKSYWKPWTREILR